MEVNSMEKVMDNLKIAAKFIQDLFDYIMNFINSFGA